VSEAVGDIDNSGRYNRNPMGMSLLALVREDFATHHRSIFEPGFWAIAHHRFGNARMVVRWRVLRAPLSLLYFVSKAVIGVLWGIDLPYTMQLGRRVRIWHYGCMIIGARAIGDDVTLRHATTMGLLHQGDPRHLKPVIGDRVDIGSGVAILGGIRVGAGAKIGANSVVVKDVPPGVTVFGVPARPVDLGRPRAPRE
jgi:serine O-acetyltransferase